MKNIKKKIPILGPLLGLVDSRKAQVVIAGVISVFLVNRAGLTQEEAMTISGAIVILAATLIHAIMKEDVADKTNGNGKGPSIQVSGFVGDEAKLASELGRVFREAKDEEEGGAQDG